MASSSASVAHTFWLRPAACVRCPGGPTSVEFDVKGAGWAWGPHYALDSLAATGGYHSAEGLQLQEVRRAGAFLFSVWFGFVTPPLLHLPAAGTRRAPRGCASEVGLGGKSWAECGNVGTERSGEAQPRSRRWPGGTLKPWGRAGAHVCGKQAPGRALKGGAAACTLCCVVWRSMAAQLAFCPSPPQRHPAASTSCLH